MESLISFIFYQQTRSVVEHHLYNGQNYELQNPSNNNDSAAIQRYYVNNVSWQGATSSCDICMLQVDFIPIDHRYNYSNLHYKKTANTLPIANPENASINPYGGQYFIHKQPPCICFYSGPFIISLILNILFISPNRTDISKQNFRPNLE